MRRIDGLGGDIRDRIDHLDWEIGRVPEKDSVTFHYNGPSLDGVERWSLDDLIGFINRADVPNHIARIGADGLQYHFVCHRGQCYQTRDLDAKLWHCANSYGNSHSVAVHFPIGASQVLPDETWAAGIKLAERLQAEFKMKAGHDYIVAHQEWRGAATACPGGDIMRRLKAYRQQPVFQSRPDDAAGQYVVLADVLRIRQAPNTKSSVALGGKAVMGRGALFDVDSMTQGEAIDGNSWWLHRSDGIGFVSARWARKVR